MYAEKERERERERERKRENHSQFAFKKRCFLELQKYDGFSEAYHKNIRLPYAAIFT